MAFEFEKHLENPDDYSFKPYMTDFANLAVVQRPGTILGHVIEGGIFLPTTSQTATYTATRADHTILCGAGNQTFTVTLPAASGVIGLILNIKNIGTGTITVDGNASETIDGGTTATLSTQFESISIHCDGSNWHII